MVAVDTGDPPGGVTVNVPEYVWPDGQSLSETTLTVPISAEPGVGLGLGVHVSVAVRGLAAANGISASDTTASSPRIGATLFVVVDIRLADTCKAIIRLGKHSSTNMNLKFIRLPATNYEIGAYGWHIFLYPKGDALIATDNSRSRHESRARFWTWSQIS